MPDLFHGPSKRDLIVKKVRNLLINSIAFEDVTSSTVFALGDNLHFSVSITIIVVCSEGTPERRLNFVAYKYRRTTSNYSNVQKIH